MATRTLTIRRFASSTTSFGAARNGRCDAGIDASTLSPTGLVNEVFFRFNDDASRVNDRAHFYALAARVMRQVLLDHQREKLSITRCGNIAHFQLTSEPLASDGNSINHFALGQALDSLRRFDRRAAQVVELHFYCGLNLLEIADLISVSDKLVRRDWESACAYLFTQLSSR